MASFKVEHYLHQLNTISIFLINPSQTQPPQIMALWTFNLGMGDELALFLISNLWIQIWMKRSSIKRNHGKFLRKDCVNWYKFTDILMMLPCLAQG